MNSFTINKGPFQPPKMTNPHDKEAQKSKDDGSSEKNKESTGTTSTEQQTQDTGLQEKGAVASNGGKETQQESGDDDKSPPPPPPNDDHSQDIEDNLDEEGDNEVLPSTGARTRTHGPPQYGPLHDHSLKQRHHRDRSDRESALAAASRMHRDTIDVHSNERLMNRQQVTSSYRLQYSQSPHFYTNNFANPHSLQATSTLPPRSVYDTPSLPPRSVYDTPPLQPRTDAPPSANNSQMDQLCRIMGDLATSVRGTLEHNNNRGPRTELPKFHGLYHESFERFERNLHGTFHFLGWGEGSSSRWSCLQQLFKDNADTVYYSLPEAVRMDFHLVMESFRAQFGKHTKDMRLIHQIIESCRMVDDKLDMYDTEKHRLLVEADLAESEQVRLYISGLTIDVQCRMDMCNPSTMQEAKLLARRALTGVKLRQQRDQNTNKMCEVTADMRDRDTQSVAAVSHKSVRFRSKSPYPRQSYEPYNNHQSRPHRRDRTPSRDRYRSNSRDGYRSSRRRDDSRSRERYTPGYSRSRRDTYDSYDSRSRRSNYDSYDNGRYPSPHRQHGSRRHYRSGSRSRYGSRTRSPSHDRSNSRTRDGYRPRGMQEHRQVRQDPDLRSTFCNTCNDFHPYGRHTTTACHVCGGPHLKRDCALNM